MSNPTADTVASDRDQPTETHHPQEGYSKKAAKGAAWTGSAQMVARGLRVVSTTVLAALLLPEDFGIVGVVTSISAFVNIFRNSGTGAAIVQHRAPDRQILDTVFTFNTTVGLLSTIVIWVLAPYLSWFFEDARLEQVLRVASLTFLFSAFSIVPSSILQREMRFGTMACFGLGYATAMCIGGISMALMGFGVWSLIVPEVVIAPVFAVLKSIVVPYRWSFGASKRAFWEVFPFSGFMTLFSLVKYFARNSDILLVAKYLGMSSAGIYGLASGLMLLPLQAIVDVVKRVIFPAFSRIQDDDTRFRNAYIRAVAILTFLAYPAIIGLCLVVEDAVMMVYGSAWVDTIWVFWMIAPVGLCEATTSSTTVLFQSKGRVDLLFIWTLIMTLLTLIAFAVGLQWGVNGMAACYSLVTLLTVVPNLWLAHRLIGLKLPTFLGTLAPNAICSAGMAIAVLSSARLLNADSHAINLVFKIAVGVISYGALSLVLNRSAVSELKKILR